MVKLFFKAVLGFMVAFVATNVLGSFLAFLEMLTGIPVAKAYLSSGMCYPVGLMAYCYFIWRCVTAK